MRITFEIGHPAQVHLFRYVLSELKDRHEIRILIKERESMVGVLLNHYGFEYSVLQPNSPNIFGKMKNLVINDIKLFNISRELRTDVFVSVASPYSAHVSALLGKPHISLTDTEDANIQLKLMVPFTDAILTPDCFLKDFPENKHIRYPGYHELAYLHPKRFKPDPSILELLGVEKDEKYVIMRFSAWDASHDLGQHGFRSDDERMKLVKMIEKHAKVFITSEIPMVGDLEKRRINIPPHRIHDALHFSSLYIGDGHKMAAEAGILGVPSILISTRWKRTGNFIDFVKKYHTVEAFEEVNNARKRALEILQDAERNKREWKERSESMLKDKIDVSSFLIYFIENYPESHKEYIEDADSLFKKFKN